VDCLVVDDCPIGHLCIDKTCVTGCNSDRDCPGDLHCDDSLGEHGACVECLIDDDCGGDEVCHDNICRFSCSSNDDCSVPTPVCDLVTGACVPCLVKADCLIGHLCVDQVCVPGCEDDQDCPAGDECESGQCQEECIPSGEEVCDGDDNNCDGRTDAEDPQLVLEECELTEGVCAGSHHPASQCLNGSWEACTPEEYGPAFGDEVCDGLDTDCSGGSDDGMQLDCQDDYVCQADECIFSGGCTSECQEGSTDCSWLDSSYVKICRDIDEDPCLEWDQEDCPPNSYCDPIIFNRCVCDYDQCGGVCCSYGQVCDGSDDCCTPACPARTCGTDGCGGSCECDLPNDQCLDYVCVCTPACAGKQCG
ncbi:MAG: hypothetical protein JRJ19_03360, partial [Deltaproteobacteria bacterium]|nr:hypothetical protein [Deltaproteobacteria bacterium]